MHHILYFVIIQSILTEIMFLMQIKLAHARPWRPPFAGCCIAHARAAASWEKMETRGKIKKNVLSHIYLICVNITWTITRKRKIMKFVWHRLHSLSSFMEISDRLGKNRAIVWRTFHFIILGIASPCIYACIVSVDDLFGPAVKEKKGKKSKKSSNVVRRIFMYKIRCGDFFIFSKK